MIIITKQLPIDFNLFLFGDAHDGSKLYYERGFDEFIDTVANPYEGLPSSRNYAVDHGDAIEAIAVDDFRFDPETMDDPSDIPMAQADRRIAKLSAIKSHMIAMLMGNHELKLKKYTNFTKYICKELGVPYGTYAARIIYTDHKGELIFKHYATHGRKMISSTADDPKRRLANMELVLKRHLKFKAGDCLLQSKGHTHKLLVCRPNTELYITDDGEKTHQKYTHSHRAAGYIHSDHRWYVNTGSFLKLFGDGYSGYGEIAEYDPLELGYAVVIVRDRMIQDIKKVIL